MKLKVNLKFEINLLIEVVIWKKCFVFTNVYWLSPTKKNKIYFSIILN